MPRPTKWRKVGFLPDITYFKPAGVPLRELDEVVVTVEELEAVRLRDLKDLEQEECAKSMGISRPTFFRIINSARSKIAEALITGKAIRIEGGKYRFSNKVKCLKCGHIWEEVQKDDNPEPQCPACRSKQWAPTDNRKGWRHGQT